MKIKFLRVFNGDAIHLRYKNNGFYRNILIDGGPGKAYQGLNGRKRLEDGDLKRTVDKIAYRNEKIDLLIITHSHEDHIGGIIKWFEQKDFSEKFVTEVWFNSARLIGEYFKKEEIIENLTLFEKEGSLDTSAKHDSTFENYIEILGIWKKRLFLALDEISYNDIKFVFLSPTEKEIKPYVKKQIKEEMKLDTSARKNDYEKSISEHLRTDYFSKDTSIYNGSSLAFIIEYQNKNYVFLGDAHSDVVERSIELFNLKNRKKLKAEFIKLSHHGSRFNTTKKLINLIDCNTFIVSTNSEEHNHPDKLCMARIIKNCKNAHIKFNYPELIDEIFSEKDRYEHCFITSSTEE
ncbi:MAG: MBL fold metallo-hydrolase [Candidatus Lokiarchaeota archaeon]|nr:MBL fold metallo-hydrolase [Candidatus Lokiarchaeota archaeon]